jgi:hypothetical protein
MIPLKIPSRKLVGGPRYEGFTKIYHGSSWVLTNNGEPPSLGGIYKDIYIYIQMYTQYWSLVLAVYQD